MLTLVLRDEQPLVQLQTTRTLSSIIFTCLFTLFTCIWCCVRPDIPSPYDSKLRILLTKFNIIFWVLISPEMVAFWSFRQWYEAGRIAEEFKDRGWTRRHALFLLMGGFMLCKDGQPVQTLSILRFRSLLEQGIIEFPSTSTSDIQERNTLHPTFTFLVVLQVTWFTLQCVSRLAKGLLITQLEVITLTLLLVNGIILLFSWEKPLDTQYPVNIHTNLDLEHLTAEPGQVGSIKNDFKREKGSDHIIKRFVLAEGPSFYQPSMTTYRFIKRLPQFLAWPVRSLYQDFGRLAVNVQSPEIPSGALKIPFFYVPDSTDLFLFVLPVVITLGTGIGVVNCLFWSWGYFPSFAARLVWRINSVTVAGFCALFLVLMSVITLTQLWNQVTLSGVVDAIADFFVYLGVLLFLIAFMPYIVARITILLESFVCLKSLPQDAFEVVSWTNYIPHFA